MTDNEIINTDEQIIKSLKWLIFNFPKVENPKDDADRMCNCINEYCKNAIDLINSKNSKIRELNKEKAEISKLHWNDWEIHCNAINEFAERLKKEALIESGFEVLQTGTIDNLVKEMAGEK